MWILNCVLLYYLEIPQPIGKVVYLYDISIDFEAKMLDDFGWILQIWVIVDKTEKLPNLMVYNYNSCRTLWWTVKDYFILFMWHYFSTVLKGQFSGQFYVTFCRKWHYGRYKYIVWNLLTFVYFTYVLYQRSYLLSMYLVYLRVLYHVVCTYFHQKYFRCNRPECVQFDTYSGFGSDSIN